ncbi:D-isomer specific 2-hydroxyacid dehydrogenase [Xylariaceae sp. FL1272]|nr:D-isomer specific 2-hydroxyacid dehydrogenase [Xylariaceae sp. FL1272]
MAEPTNTPMPTAPPTPRAGSPAPPLPTSLASSPTSTRSPAWPHPHSQTHSRAESLTVPINSYGPKQVVLHLGDPVKHAPELFAEFSVLFDVVCPSLEDRCRPAFINALRDKKWGDIAVVFRPSLAAGLEMGAWNDEIISLLPNSVRGFVSAGIGCQWVDVNNLAERGIVFCNSEAASAEAIADFAVTLILATFRPPAHYPSSAQGQASTSKPGPRSHNPRGHVLGIVGFDHVGQQIAHKCHAAFGMDIIYYDVKRKSASIEVGSRARFCPTLDLLLHGSDCVVLCPTSSQGQDQLINPQNIGEFRPGARLVNVGGSQLVDESVLALALEQDAMRFVALDVHGDDPEAHGTLSKFVGTKALLTYEDAADTIETYAGTEELCMRNAIAILSGREPTSAVNLPQAKQH